MSSTLESVTETVKRSRRASLPVLSGGSRGLSLTPEEQRQLERGVFDTGFKYLPVELFKTERSFFVFDARNVSFLEVEEVTFDMLAILRERNASLDELVGLLPQHKEKRVRRAYRDILDAQADGLLVNYEFRRAQRHENSEYEEVLSQRMGGFTIFITTRCNLGCSYCIYGGQYEQHEELSQVPMPWETVKATMDFLERHSRKSEQVRLDFFGGEPLLAFDMIERGVQYLKSIVSPEGPRVEVTITSNGTVLTERILNFLLEHDVYLQFSVDGDRANHDMNRPYKNTARGSFDTILKNLQKIYDRSPDYFRRRMRLKGVLTNESNQSDDFEFFSHPLIKIIIDESHFTFLNLEPHYDLAEDAEYFRGVHELGEKLLQMRGLESEADILANLNIKQKSLYRHTLGHFFEGQAVNQVYFNGSDETPFTKGCLTGYQEGAVNTNGDISICLKSAKGNNFVIGNVNEGEWYYEKMRELNTRFHRDWSGCSSCFVQKMCDLCYEKINGEEGEWVAGRSKFCEFNRERYRTTFDYMLRTVENNPALWQELERIIRERLESQAAQSESDADQFGSRSLFSGSETD
ncbi:MAG TPA: radical SAM protein [Pyrinomonadaceae bacterium]|nr:radical SAM protein [Pyrinomonadaceae bacterium]